MSSVVRSFFKDVLQNPRLKPYFFSVATEKLIHHQIIFISQRLGKPVSEKLNTNQAMKRDHAGKRISESAFLEVTEVLKNVLVAHQMEEDDIAAVMAQIMGFKSVQSLFSADKFAKKEAHPHYGPPPIDSAKPNSNAP
jgi:truncated hemoglobin YjbI